VDNVVGDVDGETALREDSVEVEAVVDEELSRETQQLWRLGWPQRTPLIHLVDTARYDHRELTSRRVILREIDEEPDGRRHVRELEFPEGLECTAASPEVLIPALFPPVAQRRRDRPTDIA